MKKLLNAIDLSKKTIDYDEYKYLDGPHDVWEAFMKDRNYMVDDDEDEVMDDDRVAVPEPDTKTLEAILLLNKQYQESDNQSLYKETLNDARGVSVIVTVDTHTELPLMYVDVDEAATPAEQGEGPSDEHLQNHDPKNDIDGDQTHRKTPNKNIPRYEARKHTRKKSGKSRQPDARGFFS